LTKEGLARINDTTLPKIINRILFKQESGNNDQTLNENINVFNPTGIFQLIIRNCSKKRKKNSKSIHKRRKKTLAYKN
jgi:hypothetical protein